MESGAATVVVYGLLENNGFVDLSFSNDMLLYSLDESLILVNDTSNQVIVQKGATSSEDTLVAASFCHAQISTGVWLNLELVEPTSLKLTSTCAYNELAVENGPAERIFNFPNTCEIIVTMRYEGM